MAEKKKATTKAKGKQASGRVMIDGKPVLKEWEPFVKKYNIKSQREFDAAIKKHVDFE